MSPLKKTDIGLIPSDWDCVLFNEVAQLRHGHQFRNYDFTTGGLKVVKITQIQGDGTMNLSSCSFIESNRLEEFKEDIINKGDILIALTGATIGKIARYNSDEVVLQNYRVGNFFSKDENKLSRNYLFQFLRSNFFFHQILARQTQSAQQNIGKDEINNMDLFLPPISEQKAIAKVLTAFDNKIELLQAQNKTLETMAQTIFKEWFGKYQVGDELPEGWRVGKITELFEVRDGTHDSPKETKNGKQLITSRHVSRERIKFEESYFISDEDYNAINKRSKVDQFDILFSMIGTLGLTYFEQNTDIDYAIKNLALFKTSQRKEYSIYTYLWLIGVNGKHYVLKNKSGSTQEFMSLSSLRNIEFVIPSDQNLIDFNSLCEPIFKKIKINSSQIQSLTKTRGTLLPKLMSGQVRVKNINQTANA